MAAQVASLTTASAHISSHPRHRQPCAPICQDSYAIT